MHMVTEAVQTYRSYVPQQVTLLVRCHKILMIPQSGVGGCSDPPGWMDLRSIQPRVVGPGSPYTLGWMDSPFVNGPPPSPPRLRRFVTILHAYGRYDETKKVCAVHRWQ